MDSKSIKKVACIGAGIIGSSWATYFAMKGYPVAVCDISETQLDDARKFVEKNLAYLEEKGLLTKGDVEKALSHVNYTTDYEKGLSDVQFIQENGPENYEIKQTILKQAEKYADKGAIYSSSTSGLLMTEIAKYAEHPERCLGAHPYNPPHLIPLVEITKGEKTSEEAVNCAYDFFKVIGKEPIILKKETPGFIANRLQVGLWREAVELVNRGVCTFEDIDKATVFGPGLRWAILGTSLNLELSGGKVGIEGLIHHLEDSFSMWLEDMAAWKKFPDHWDDNIQESVNQQIAKRAPEFGNNHEDIIRFRDDCLLKILQMHKKL